MIEVWTNTQYYRVNKGIISRQIIWARTRENLSSGVCEQHRRRPACASAQSDQRLCYSLFKKYHMLTCYRWNFNFLASLRSWGDLFETRIVRNPEDRFSRDVAHIAYDQCWGNNIRTDPHVNGQYLCTAKSLWQLQRLVYPNCNCIATKGNSGLLVRYVIVPRLV